MGILEVSGWDWDKVTHASGTRLKYWLINPEDKTRGLFKVPRDNTGEAWAEQIASDLGQLIDYSVVRSYLANFNGTLGTLSVNFNRLGEELFEGGDLISQRFMDFNRYSLVRYEFDLIIDILKEYDLDQSFLYVPVFALEGGALMSFKPFELWLVWQNPWTRQRYHVGSLLHTDTEYIFHYVDQGSHTLQDAIANGYKLHVAFPEKDKNYISKELFVPFERRLPDKRRPDFQDILKELGLSRDYTPMDLLRATGGRLATDTYEFVVPIQMHDDKYSIDFFVAGWRYYQGDQVREDLRPGTVLKLVPEPENPYDSQAIIVYSRKGTKLGYVPVFYSWFLHEIIRTGNQYLAEVLECNFDAEPQLKCRVGVVGSVHELADTFLRPLPGCLSPPEFCRKALWREISAGLFFFEVCPAKHALS